MKKAILAVILTVAVAGFCRTATAAFNGGVSADKAMDNDIEKFSVESNVDLQIQDCSWVDLSGYYSLNYIYEDDVIEDAQVALDGPAKPFPGSTCARVDDQCRVRCTGAVNDWEDIKSASTDHVILFIRDTGDGDATIDLSAIVDGVPSAYVEPVEEVDQSGDESDESSDESLADTDGDGVSDIDDQCAATPAGVTTGSDGCPVDTSKSDNSSLQGFDDGASCTLLPSAGANSSLYFLLFGAFLPFVRSKKD